jgi:hypothetical protein
MSTEACQAPYQIRTIAPLPAGFQRTPEWHRARAQLLRWLNDPSTRWLARQHLNLAKRPLPNAGQNVDEAQRSGCQRHGQVAGPTKW